MQPGKPPEVAEEACRSCGLCLPVCPTDALELNKPGLAWDALLKKAEQLSAKQPAPKPDEAPAPLTISCQRRDDVVWVPCLGMLDQSYLVTLGLHTGRPLRLESPDCEECQFAPGGRAATRRAAAAGALMQRLTGRGIERVVLSAQGASGPPVTTKRRFFQMLGRAGLGLMLSPVAEWVPEPRPAGKPYEQTVPPRRKLLAQALQQAGIQPDTLNEAGLPDEGTWPLADVRIDNETCTNCGVCGNLCPTGALVWQALERIVFDPSLCTACGLCVEVCQPKSVAVERSPSLAPVAVPAGQERRVLAQIRMLRCEECGAFYPDRGEDGCPRCRMADEESYELFG